MVALGSINSWQPGDGVVTTWTASPASRRLAQRAARDPLPPSSQQASHLRAIYRGGAMGREFPRLIVVAWDIPGVCDITAMTTAITAHVRRHDTYRSRFDVDDDAIARRTLAPEDIELAPETFGPMDAEQIRTHSLTTTPGTLEWDCFTFGIVQKPDHFTFYASVDHLHFDLTSGGLIFLDIHLAYQALVANQPITLPEAGSYRDYTAGQQATIATMTSQSPAIKGWIDFAADAEGDWPSFPLPLGDTLSHNRGDFVSAQLLDAEQTESFDIVCREAGARFSGGVMACAALSDHEFTGRSTFQGFTPSDTRTLAEAMTLGWCASLFPVTVPIGDGEFGKMARAAQQSFDARRNLSQVPLERVLEQAMADEIDIRLPRQMPMMLSYLDVRKFPVAEMWARTGFGVYADNLSHGGINAWITRHAGGTGLTVSFPDNPEARQSVDRYVAVLTRVFQDVAAATADWLDEITRHANNGYTPA